MSPLRFVPGTPAPTVVVPPPTDPPARRYKAVQISTPPATSPTLAQLQDLNIGAVRAIAHWARTPAELEAYLAPIWAAGIFVILCITQNTGANGAGVNQGMHYLDYTPPGQPFEKGWQTRVTEIVAGVPSAGILELMNEPGFGFRYSTGAENTQVAAPANETAADAWFPFFRAAEDAAAIITGPPYNRRCILGAAESADTNHFLEAAQRRYGPKFTDATRVRDWSTFYTGVAIHPYGHGGAIWKRKTSLGTVASRLNNARAANRLGNNGATGDLNDKLPLWSTECGVGAGGNSLSQMVAATDVITTTARNPSGATFQVVDNASGPFTFLTTSMPAAFTSRGSPGAFIVRAYTTNPNTTILRKITYTGISGNSFTGCHVWDAVVGEKVAGGQTVDFWVPDGDAIRNAAQGQIVEDYFAGVALGAYNGTPGKANDPADATFSWGSLWSRSGTAAQNVKAHTWFIYRDYGGHSGGAPVNPANWAEFCGLVRWSTTQGFDLAGDADPITPDTATTPALRRTAAYANFKAADPFRTIA